MEPSARASTDPNEGQSRLWGKVGIGHNAEPTPTNHNRHNTSHQPTQPPLTHTMPTNPTTAQLPAVTGTPKIPARAAARQYHRMMSSQQDTPDHTCEPEKPDQPNTTNNDTARPENSKRPPPKPPPPTRPPPEPPPQGLCSLPPPLPRWNPVTDDPNNPDLIEELETHLAITNPNYGLDALFADTLTSTKPDNHMRLAFGNVGGLPVSKNEPKSRHFIDQLRHFKIDAFLGSETDWYLPNIKAEDSWIERTREFLRRQTYLFAFNKHDKHNTKRSQTGGTFTVALNEAQPRIIQKEVDDSGLGRWTWMRIQGRQGHTVSIISAYRPNNNKTTPRYSLHATEKPLGQPRST